MIARWPGRIAKGQVSDHLCYFPDLLPTFAEIAQAKAPEDTDGISFLPELVGAAAAGREQATHEYLYWELGRQTAVRKGEFKAIRTKKGGPWALYDLSQDLSETKDVAAAHPDLLEQMRAFAVAAHEPVESGTFADRADHEKDRRAKGLYRPGGKRRKLPTRGSIPREGWKVLRVSSESRGSGRLAAHAIDGDSRTHWHTDFGSETPKHPHEILIDMGASHQVRGFFYLGRQDKGWNGAFGECEFHVSEDLSTLGKGAKPALTATFERKKSVQKVTIDPIRGRYVLVRALSEVAGGPWASAAEIGVLGK